MEQTPHSASESSRLAALRSYEILDTPGDEMFDNITLLATHICGTPIGLVSFVDEERQWFKSHQGLAATETPRAHSFCAHALETREGTLEVNDAELDARFARNPLVTGDPKIRFYAGASLETPNGERLGTLCVIDRAPRALTSEQRRCLRALADQVMALLELRRVGRSLVEHRDNEARLAAEAERERRSLEVTFQASPMGMAVVREPDFVFERVNEAFKVLVGPREYLRRRWTEVYSDLLETSFIPNLTEVYRTGVRCAEKEVPIRVTSPDGVVEDRRYDISYDRIDGADDARHGVLIVIVDVTEEVRARDDLRARNRELAETQRKLAAATKVARVGFFEWDVVADKLEFSSQMREDWGFGAGGSLAGMMSRILARDRDSVKARLEHAIATGEPYRAEYRIHRPDRAHSTWIEAQGEVTRDEHGRVVTFLGTSVDVTSRKRAEREIQAIANAIPQLAWTADVTGARTWFNERWYEYTGVDFAGVAAWGWVDLIHPHHRRRVLESYRETLARGRDWEETYPVRGADQKFRWFLARARPLRDESGAILKWFGSNTDVTAQKDAESTLTRLAAVVETSRDFIGMSDASFTPIFVNEGGRAMSGFGARDVHQSRIVDFFQPDQLPRIEAEVIPTLVERGYWEGELAFRHFETGATIPVHYVIFAIVDPKTFERIGYATVTRDISDRKRFEAGLEQARDAAERANGAKSIFLANMSHEIRSPLGAIIGFTDLLRDGNLAADEVHAFIAVIQRNSGHVLRIIDDILDLSKVEAGKMVIEDIEVSLSDLLADFASLVGLKAREKGIAFEFSLASGIPERARTDPTRLRQILNNVVGNAIKFTERGRVDLSVGLDGECLVFRVTDTGIGLSADQATRLFRAFEQADATTTRKFGGTGLGLVLTRRIAEAMGGSFDLERSEIGRGSTFRAVVRVRVPSDSPIVNVVRAGRPTAAVEAKEASRPLEGMSILVIEDSPDNQTLFELTLTRLGALIEIASDGRDGVDRLASATFDAVLCDVQMPRMDGYEVMDELRRRGDRTPVIALTAHAMKEERDRALAAGFTDFVSKPLRTRILVDALLRATRGS